MQGLRARVIEALRRLARHRRLLPFTALMLRARTVRPSYAFLARELLRRRVIAVYRVRENNLRVALRHRSGDVVTLGEVFHEHDYEPPAELAARLRETERVLDLGANIGLFGVFAAARWPLAEILAFEPDPVNADVHERTIAANGLDGRWRLVRAAAGADEGRVRFVAGEAALSRLASPEESHAIEVPIEDVMPAIAGADLVKMDIEGGEWAILGDERFRSSPPPVIVLEYHPRLCPTADPRLSVESALEVAGMTVSPIWHRADGHGMLWAWQS